MSAYAPPTRAVPPGWAPPYQGPPPKPAHMNVNQQQWNAGRWQFNSAFVGQHPAPPQHQLPWQPGQAWPQMSQHFHAPPPQQQQPNHNPYKKPIREPSAEYMASKLSDNPLGLHGLVPVENRYGDEGRPDAPTPWIWTPAELADDDADSPGATAHHSHGHNSRPTEPPRNRQGSEPPMPTHQRDTKNVRHTTDPTPSRKPSIDHGRNGISSSSASASASASALASSSSGRDSLPALDRPLVRPTNPDFYRRRGLSPPRQSDQTSHPNDVSSRHTSQSVQDHHRQPPPPPPVQESFTAKQELVPTFSSGIIRTPEHYRSSSRSSSVSSMRENSQSSMDSVTSRMQRLSTSSGTSSRNEPLTRHSSMPSTTTTSFNTPESSISGSTLVDEPSSILSPLMMAQTPKPKSRAVQRHPTYPDTSLGPGAHALATISESPASSQDLTPMPTRRVTLQQHTPPEHYPSPANMRRSSSHDESPARGRTPANIYAQAKITTPPRDAAAGHTLNPSPSGNNSTRHRDAPVMPTPLPSPLTPTHTHEGEPVPRVYLKIGMPAPPLPGVSRVPRRKGFWNRRGDHVHGGYVVYAPQELAYPEELKDYPPEDVGYRDEFGSELKYDPDRPELADSLPVKGQPPIKPYRSLIIYDNQPSNHPYPSRPSSSVRIS